MSALTLACGIVVGLIVAYRFGYYHGVAYCMRQLKPLADAAKSISELARRR